MVTFLKKESNDSPKGVSCIEVFLDKGKVIEYNIVVIRRHKKHLYTKKIRTSIRNIKEVAAEVSTKYPVYMVIAGPGIKTQKITGNGTNIGDILVWDLIEKAELNNLIIEKHGSDYRNYFVTTAHKGLVEELIDKLLAVGVYIEGYLIGSLHTECLIPLFAEVPESLIAGGYKLSIKGTIINDCRNIGYFQDSQEYIIGNENILSEALGAFSGCIHFFLSGKRSSVSIPALEKSRKEARMRKRFRKTSVYALLISALFFTISLLYAFQEQRLEVIKHQIRLYDGMENDLNRLQRKLAGKKKNIENAGFLQNYNFSALITSIVSNKPEETRIDQIECNTILNENGSTENTDNLGEIKIVVITTGKINLIDWTRQITENERIQKLEITDKEIISNQNGILQTRYTIKIKVK